MIEKWTKGNIDRNSHSYENGMSHVYIMEKINKLIDAVNTLQSIIDSTEQEINKAGQKDE